MTEVAVAALPSSDRYPSRVPPAAWTLWRHQHQPSPHLCPTVMSDLLLQGSSWKRALVLPELLQFKTGVLLAATQGSKWPAAPQWVALQPSPRLQSNDFQAVMAPLLGAPEPDLPWGQPSILPAATLPHPLVLPGQPAALCHLLTPPTSYLTDGRCPTVKPTAHDRRLGESATAQREAGHFCC